MITVENAFGIVLLSTYAICLLIWLLSALLAMRVGAKRNDEWGALVGFILGFVFGVIGLGLSFLIPVKRRYEDTTKRRIV